MNQEESITTLKLELKKYSESFLASAVHFIASIMVTCEHGGVSEAL
jgi:hypothetical protein